MKGLLLTAAQHRSLESQLWQTGDTALARRILALLELDQGRPVSEVARLVRADRRRVQRWRSRYLAGGGLAALRQQPGQGRPSVWNADLAGQLQAALAHRPDELGQLAMNWTVPLLQAALPGEPALSAATLRRRLHTLGYVWKRFRYVLAPDPEREKKTQNPPANPRFARAGRPPGPGRNGPAALSALAGRLGSPRPARAR